MVPKINLEQLQNSRPNQLRDPDQNLVKEVRAGLHPTMTPFTQTQGSKVPNNSNRIMVEAEHAPDAPEGARRFVDLGAATEKNKNRMFTGDPNIGMTPAQVGKYLGRGLDKDAPFTTNMDIGKFNLGMPNGLSSRSYMVRPDGMRGNFQQGGVNNPLPLNATTQKNPTMNSPMRVNVNDPVPRDPLTGEPLKTTDDMRTAHGNNKEFKEGFVDREPHLFSKDNPLLGDMKTPELFDPLAAGVGISSKMRDTPQGVDMKNEKHTDTGKKRRSLTGGGDTAVKAKVTDSITTSNKAQEKIRKGKGLDSPLWDDAKDGAKKTGEVLKKGAQKTGELAKKGYKNFKDTLLLKDNETLFKKGYDVRSKTKVDKAWDKLDQKVSDAYDNVDSKTSAAFKKLKNNKIVKGAGKILDKAGKWGEKAARNPWAQAGLASISAGTELFDWATDGGIQGVKGITSVKYDPKKGYSADAVSMEVNENTFKEYNQMVKDLNLLDGLSEKYGKGDSQMLPNKATDMFASGNKRPTGALAMEKFLTYANELGSDATDDPQMAMFVAQSLQFAKDAKALPANSAKQSMENVAQSKEMILEMAQDFIKMRNYRKNSEWKAWAQAKGKRSTGGKAMAFLGLSETDWVNPFTKETESGAPANDPVLEWSMGSPARDIEMRKSFDNDKTYRQQVQGIRN